MNEKKEKTIYINWEGPYSYSEIMEAKNTNKGIYQIYSSHPLYGEDTLTYIGKTEQEFYKRLKNRRILTFGKDVENIKIYLGVLYLESIYSNIEKFSNYLEYAETLLINYHSPAKNSSNINSFKHWDDDIIVINRGNYKMLHQTVSSKAFYQDEQAFNELDDLIKKIDIEYLIEDKYDKYRYYGYYLNKDQTLWVGLDSDYWMNDTVLVFQAKEKLNDLFKETIDLEWYYKELRGSEEDIIKEIKSYIK